MKERMGVLSQIRWIAPLAMVLITAGQALAQDRNNPMLGAGLGAGILLMFFVFFVAVYVYMALALQTIADKTKTENSWLAWIPIANLILLVNIAKKPLWWIVLFLIPVVNIVIAVMVWMAAAEARGKPSWWGVLMIVPIANLIMPGMLAWSD
jgi:Family of unknown function (DUF5684)